MAEDDLTRELVRRAYAGEPVDTEAGLAEVVRRAGRPPVSARRPAVSGRHRRAALAGVFAGVIGLVLAIGAATGRLGGGPGAPVGVAAPSLAGGRPGASASGSAKPWPSGPATPTVGGEMPGGPSTVLPSQCAAGWDLAFGSGQFRVTDPVGTCPPLDPARIWLLDDHSNGLLFPGSGTVWPAVTTGTTISPPFTFSVPAIPQLREQHAYELYYLPAGVHPAPGQDAAPVLQHAMVISGPARP